MTIVNTLLLALTILLGASPSAAYSFDCGVPSSCTNSVLNSDASGYTCGSRIEWVISEGRPEDEACRLVASEQSACASCMPNLSDFDRNDYSFDCGVPDTCTNSVLNTDASGYTCGSRIQWVMENQGKSEADACSLVANEQSNCKPCGPSVTVINQAPSTTFPLQLGTMVWSEEFSSGSTPSDSFWNYDIGRGPNNDGWGNWEVQHYSSDSSNVNVNSGILNINVQKETVNGETKFTSARLKTNGKFEFLYGSVEASIKLPDCNGGLWPAFWLLGSTVSSEGWPKCGEIDILEAGNKDSIAAGVVNNRVSSAGHWSIDGNYAFYSEVLTTGFDLSSGFHKYRMDWTPTFVNTFVDGNLMWSFDIGSCQETHCTEFHQPFFFLLNVAVGGIFTGVTDKNLISAITPGQMQIDYIRVYNNEVVNAQLFLNGRRARKYLR
jgi:beta-glucanase (GH16 family)